jgi:hydroxypyruvate isomerase
MQRRDALKKSILGASAFYLGSNAILASESSDHMDLSQKKGLINHSVARWTMGHLSLEELCLLVKKIGFSAIDLIGPKEWPILKKYGIDSSMCNGAEINLVDGWNDPKNHNTLVDNYLKHIDLVADAGYTNLICFTGNRRGMDDETGLNNCVTGLKKIMSKAEKRKVIIQLELFNSRIDHKDYMADKSAFGIELCKRLGSPNFKLLYDIYHMQINEGDVIRSIQDNHQYFGHYHTAGVPGRHEIDDTQELYYPAIMKAIANTGYKGYVAQEYISKSEDPKKIAASLKKAIQICTI